MKVITIYILHTENFKSVHKDRYIREQSQALKLIMILIDRPSCTNFVLYEPNLFWLYLYFLSVPPKNPILLIFKFYPRPTTSPKYFPSSPNPLQLYMNQFSPIKRTTTITKFPLYFLCTQSPTHKQRILCSKSCKYLPTLLNSSPFCF